ncbi:MotA/TolQ/ExbB proton channel family protein [Polyangium jinanense]|uniref:MotA/TolQ/ExbB proton channel family protein n=3 Tax=Polyangiaceae TaxID=49 RepID=A0A9X4AV38_9BACT|nr:MotA/TolQ/ExbB proton channel family protein [Polyangium jinanense]MDC3983902.1 MotA/TolQ/ExbB proton channel family protein [Polyangium jinanense]MDC3987241.1 MotA/TolQ/ExbB proton channel family protein [Polyangium jinanense]
MRHLFMLASEGGEVGMWGAIKENPTFLVMNLVVSAIVVTVIIERAYFQLDRYRVNSKEFFAQIKKLVVAGNIDRAIKLCDAGDYPILQLVKAGLTQASKGADEIDAALSEKLSELKPAVEKRVALLWSLANIATLIGLIGTVSGLIKTFASISAPGLSAAVKQQMLSNGIAEAMYNTAFGLGIAVLCMIAHVLLHTRSKNIQHDLESTTERVFNLLTIAKPNF